ncbi:MAG: hypothetical protein LBC92_03940 [Rickettsiales bacterium]|jgi:glutaredoxin|nr:hypothetical protein [Rickettsiales bacterium]
MDFFKKNIFKICIIIVCALIFSFFAFEKHFVNSSTADDGRRKLHVFVQDGCVYCLKAEEWLKTDPFKGKINVTFYNLKDKMSSNFLNRLLVELDYKGQIGTPIFIIEDRFIMGWDEKMKDELKSILEFEKTEDMDDRSNITDEEIENMHKESTNTDEKTENHNHK